MKILIIRTFPNVLNAQAYNLQEIGLARAFSQLGHHCDIVYYNGKSPDCDEVIKVDGGEDIVIHRLKGFEILRNGFFPSLKKLIPQYDIIQTAGYDQITSFKLFTKHKNVTLYHGTYFTEYNKKYNIRCKVYDLLFTKRKKKVLKSVPCFTKSALAESFLRSKGFENVKTVGVGLDTARFEATPKVYDEWVKSLCDDKNDKKYILYIGNINDLRNVEFTVRMAGRVMEKYPKTRLLLVGKSGGDYLQKCFELAESLGIRDKIYHKDSLPQEQLPKLYECSDVFVLPTKYDIFGMVLLEAMYFGVPVITTLNGGSSTMLKNGENGFVMDAKTDFDEQKWAETICEIFNGEHENVGENGKKTVNNGFLWQDIANKFLDEYQKLL